MTTAPSPEHEKHPVNPCDLVDMIDYGAGFFNTVHKPLPDSEIPEWANVERDPECTSGLNEETA